MHPKITIILLSSLLLGQFLWAQDNRFKSAIGIPIPIAPPTDSDILDAIYLSADPKLLTSIGRTPEEREKQNPLELVWNKPIALHDADYRLCIFDSPGHSSITPAPRVLILLKSEPNGYKVITWFESGSYSAFAFASAVTPLSSKETHLITINPSSRSGGELWFERYQIDPKGISKIGEGSDPSKIGK